MTYLGRLARKSVGGEAGCLELIYGHKLDVDSAPAMQRLERERAVTPLGEQRERA